MLALVSCGDSSEAPSPAVTATQPLAPTVTTIDPGFASAGQQAIDNLTSQSERLKVTTDNFLQTTAAKQLQALQQQWIATHHAWHRAAFYLQLAELHPELLSSLHGNSQHIHQPQLQPGYLDSIEGYPASGLVNDINLPLTADSLRQQHQRYDSLEVATGLNAMEFELWYRQIEDFDPNAKPRPAQGSQNIRKDQLPQQRRRVLLRLLATLLVEDSEQLQDGWPTAVERVNTLDPASLEPLYQQLAIRELGFWQQSLQQPHSSFSQDTSWQTALLASLQTHAALWSDRASLAQLGDIEKTLLTDTSNLDEDALKQQLAQLLSTLQSPNQELEQAVSTPASGE